MVPDLRFLTTRKLLYRFNLRQPNSIINPIRQLFAPLCVKVKRSFAKRGSKAWRQEACPTTAQLTAAHVVAATTLPAATCTTSGASIQN